MIKLTNAEIINLYDLLNLLDKNTNIPIVLGYNIIHNIKILKLYYDNIMEVREKLLKENGNYTEEGYFQIPLERINLVNNQLEELLLLENIVENLQLIKVKDLQNKFEELNLNDLEILYPILKAE